MKRDNLNVNDRQLACARISSKEGENYLKAMASAANYAWVNRSSMTFLTRQVCGVASTDSSNFVHSLNKKTDALEPMSFIKGIDSIMEPPIMGHIEPSHLCPL